MGSSASGQLWGAQYPFERNHLQRMMTLIGLGGLFAVIVFLLVDADVTDVLGLTLIGAGMLCAAAAYSRRRYDVETRVGFAVLASRGGRFVLGSAAAFGVLTGLVAVLIIVD